jgi:predicted AAA+ superfamily ATPase
MKASGGLRPRRLVEVVPQRMREEPVVILTGPRTVGKSTLLAALAAEFDRPVLDLDRPDARAAAVSDPGFLVSGPGPVLIDEFSMSRRSWTRSRPSSTRTPGQGAMC